MKKLSMHTVSLVLLSASLALAGDKVPLTTSLPEPLLVGTPPEAPAPPKLEPKLKKFPVFEVPVGTANLAKDKKVTGSSDTINGTSLDIITDGDKVGDEGSWAELGKGKQWVQVDLEKSANIYAVVVWHFHAQELVYRDVIAQVSDDPAFSKDVTTIYDNSAAGKDLPYIETRFGKIMDAKGIKGRYVRLYSAGNTANKMNQYIEVEVFGKPAA
jgi:hypothetical protein